MKTLDFLIGLPASGKSTYAKIKEKENGAIVLSSDRIRKELNITTYTKEDNNNVFNVLHERLFNELQKENAYVIYDAINLSKKRHEILKEIRKRNKDVYINYIFFVASIPKCVERDTLRENMVGRNTIIKLAKSFTGFYLDKMYGLYDRIIFRHIDQILLSNEVYQAMYLEHDNVYHTNTVYKHINQVRRRIKKINNTHILDLTAFYHDLGKIYTKVFKNAKGEKTKNAHFYRHEKVSSYIFTTQAYDNVLTLIDSEFDFTFYVQALIEKHMGNPNSRKNKILDDYFKKYGYSFIKDLTIFHEADKYRTWYQKIIIGIKKRVIGTK